MNWTIQVGRDAQTKCRKYKQAAPPFGNVGESKCANRSTNINCNYIRIPWCEIARSMVPRHARQCAVDDIEFHSLKLIEHLCDVTCRPLTL